MKSLSFTIALTFGLFISLFLPSSAFAQSNIEKDWNMKQYFMVFLSKGENRSQDSLTSQKIQAAHLANIQQLFDEKKLVLAGPFLDEGDVVGIFILDVPTMEDAVKLTNTDPAVQAGRLKMEIRPWYGPGSIQISPKE